MNQAEREGFDSGSFRNSAARMEFHDNPSLRRGFRPSASSSSFPVAPGPGGAQPGQNRDNSRVVFRIGSVVALGLLLMLGMTATGGHPGARSRAEVADERRAKRDRTQDEIRAIVAEFRTLLPRDQAEAVGAAYARYSSRFQDSVADQVRAILADAVRKRVFVPLDQVYFDLAVRGFKSDREGLNALRACLDRKAAAVAFFFATNRLFRKTYKSLQFVEEQVVERGIRAVFVKSGVDTADAHRWRQMLIRCASHDEYVVGMNVENIRAAHEGLLGKRLVFGTVSFGYTGDPIPGAVTRRGRPQRRLTIDPVAGPWVRTIYRWYAADRVPLIEIVRRLNADPGVPPPKSPARAWTREAVRRLLRNPRYRGWWAYGVTETVWLSSKDYARQMTRREPLKAEQVDGLRLVPDDEWYQAQVLLDKEVERAPRRRPTDGDRASRPRVLDGLFYCATHGRKLYVGGGAGKYLVCKDCQGLPADRRPLFSQLPRALALRATCEALAGILRRDPDLEEQVVTACREEAARMQAPDPAHAAGLVARRDRLDRRIGFVLRNPGETDADQAESEGELRRLRRERAEVQAEVDAAAALAARAVVVPTEAEVRELVEGMAGVLVAAAGGPQAEDVGAVRQLIDLLTGGRIEVAQAGEPRAKGGWLVGRFGCPLLEALTGWLGGRPVPGAGSEEVRVEYRAGPDPSVAARVTELYRQGMLVKRIAGEVGLGRNAVAAILDEGFAAAGEERPDGRAALAAKRVAPPAYQAVADRVKALADQGRLFVEIAGELGLDRNTVTAAWRYWHAARGLPVPDGRGRRKTLVVKSSAAR